MTTPEGIAFGSLVLGLLGFLYKTTTDETSKRSRIYQRLDEVKKQNEEKFQSKEMCDLHTLQITNDLKEIKQDVKTLLRK